MRIGVSCFPLTTKCPFGAHISPLPDSPCPPTMHFAKMFTAEGSPCGKELKRPGLCADTLGGESGWVYSKRKRPTGPAAFYLSLGEGGRGACH